MLFVVKTQVLAVLFALLWVLNINLLAFFDSPGRALQYINWFVYGFAICFGIICFLMTKYVIGRNWLAVPLILVPYLFVYQPIFQRIQSSFMSEGYEGLVNFLSQSTGTIHLLSLIFGIALGIMFTRPQPRT
ncbi:hypothetical protein [Neobacillus soli]|uniref:hypothetical protein n=1 Tax=Neobacillus soli TaxID=220688 RepID=UPI0008241DD6|nr:hypothetical protein [Neobacillus soli]